MFKKTLVAAALAATTFSASAAVQLAGDAFQIYGQAAGFAHQTNFDGDESNLSFVLESRIGFRGVVEFENFSPNFVWQIEGGNADNGAKSGQLGARDTYIGLDFEGAGSLKFGRQLVAAYNLVDWPHSNPGLGNVFDWNNDIDAAYQDRADNTLRFDSATWAGFNFSATVSNMEKSFDQTVYSAAISYTPIPMLNLHAGYYGQADYDGTAVAEPEKYVIDADTGLIKLNPLWTAWNALGGANQPVEKMDGNNYAIVGAGLYIDAFTATLAYKQMDKGDDSQGALSATAQYVFDSTYVVKLGYAEAFESDNATEDNSDVAITGRLGYLLPSTYLYFDVRNYNMNDGETKATNFLLGAEYYF
ncbi:membrane protein [Psychromonas marina]|uniref:Membrane protein n=1 Tax=Psychromonas marina TaxID=88364 RepID=A0ABQ6DXQ2_9GAMM|nr:porin [Psychromonas marina]GLS89638.1 membrane protein [Psychromonas marina]